ncbi:unnamed protein product [Rhodiola kirilowii]
MASSSFSFHYLIVLLLLLHIVASFYLPATQAASFRPKAFVLPITKHSSTLQYLTTLRQRTPLIPLHLVVDIGGKFVWNDCETDFVSSSYKVVQFKSKACSRLHYKDLGICFHPKGPGCGKKSCRIWPYNSVRQIITNGNYIQDVVVMRSTDGSNPGRLVKVPRFLSGCTYSGFLELLADGVKGMAGLGRGDTSLPSQLADTFSFPRKFAICLGKKGVVIFGDAPYHFLPSQSTDYAKSLTYTPLLLNQNSSYEYYNFEGEPSYEYFIGVTAIKINGKQVKLNSTLLKIDHKGYGGTTISSARPYTVMQSSIYADVTDAFRKEMAHFQTVAPVAPFKQCYNSTLIKYNHLGPDVPHIDLLLQSSKVYWRIYGSNSMVQVSKEVLCLGIIDGGLGFQGGFLTSGQVTSIEIGGHTIENNLLQFDLEASKLGFSSSLLLHKTRCSGFNFTSTG